MAQMTLDTVYPTYAQVLGDTAANAQPGSLEISGGTVNIYFSNDEDEPANAAAMTLDDGSPATGVLQVVQGARWVLVETSTGTPVVKEWRVAQVPG